MIVKQASLILALIMGPVSSTPVIFAQTIDNPPEQSCITEPDGVFFDAKITFYQQLNQLTCQDRWEEAVALMHQRVLEQNNSEGCPLCHLALPLGEAQTAQQEWRQAFETYNYVLSTDAIILDGSEYDVFGYELVRYNQVDAALIAFQKLGTYLGHVEANDNQAFAYVRLGDSFFAMEHWDAAQSAYEKALQFNPNQPFAYEGLGRVWMEKEEWERAIAAFEKTIELHPTLIEPSQYIQKIRGYLDQ
jgi:tetratricopeptide (TPR) repeat protein